MLPRFAVNRPVTVLMATLAVSTFGLLAVQNLPVDLLPDLSYPTLTIQTEYQDAAPETVEQIEVKLGFETGDRIEITGTVDASVAIAPGEGVIIVGAPALSDGATVRVMTDTDSESTPKTDQQEG